MSSEFLLFQLAVFFIPGLIWAGIDSQFGRKTQQSDIQFFLSAFKFGIVSYVVTYLIYTLFGSNFAIGDISSANTKFVIDKEIFKEIALATVVGFILSILWLYATTYKVLTRILQAVGATKAYGDEDVWDYTFNSSNAAVEYVHFRDFDKNLIYGGWVSTFSSTEKLRELVLRDVIVYDFDGSELYHTPLLYIARAVGDIHIEFPYTERAKRP